VGVEVIVAAAGGAAHLPGMLAAHTAIPVLGIPVPSQHLQGLDSLLSIVQMPAGVPVGALAIGRAGAVNAALLATAIVSANRPEIRDRLVAWRAAQTAQVLETPDPQPRPGFGPDQSRPGFGPDQSRPGFGPDQPRPGFGPEEPGAGVGP
jgi:5-(carboxyamino)imidazole ribonucleotide mutase